MHSMEKQVTLVGRERNSVFRPLHTTLNKIEIQVVLSSIGVTAISPCKGLDKVSGNPFGNEKPNFANLVLNNEVIARIARAYWGIRCTLHDFITVPFQDREKVKQSLLETLRVIASEFSVKRGESFLKTHMNFYVSRSVLDHEDCPKPDKYLFYGILRRKVQLRLTRARQGSKRAKSFFYTLQMTKKTWLRLPDEVEEAALKKHAKALGTPKGSLDAEARKFIEAAVDLIVPPGTVYQRAQCCPTFSACKESSRKRGGNHGYLAVGGEISENVLSLEGETVTHNLPRFLSPGFKTVKSQDQEELCWNVVAQTFGFDDNPDIAHAQYDADPLKGRYNVEVVSLPEPGKFRILSKGPGALYTGVRSLQGFLLDQWKASQFSTMVDDLDDVVRKKYDDNLLYCFSEVVSGDFSASTDELKKEASLVANDRVLHNLGLERSRVGLMARMNFDKIGVEYKDGTYVDMLNGQLMGASLSFPILCMINLSTILRLQCKSVTDIALINGDDVSFPSTPVLTQRWNRYISDVGWTKSPGKNYVTNFTREGKVNMQINSRLYTIQRPQFQDSLLQIIPDKKKRNRKIGTTLQRVGYLHYALAIGHRVKSEPTACVKTLPAIWEKLHEHNESVRCSTLRSLFLSSNDELLHMGLTLGGRSFTPNWYFPKCLGGLGIPSHGEEVRSTVIQRKVAAYLSLHPLESWLVEKTDELPSGAQAGLRELSIMTAPLIPRSSVVSPVPYLQSMKYLEEQLGLILGAHAWDHDSTKGREEDFAIVRKIRLPKRKVDNCAPMKQKKILSYVFDYVISYDGKMPGYDSQSYLRYLNTPVEVDEVLLTLGGDLF